MADGAGEENVFEGVELGIGTWAWGDRLFWGYGQGYHQEDLEAVFNSCLNLGFNFFDTAEVYGQGLSETYLGQFIKKTNKRVKIASKFMPFPWRLLRGSLTRALQGSLKRLGITRLDRYQIHWPMPPINIETWMDAMTDVYQAGLIGAVGVSNYERGQMLRAYDVLAREGIPLASNQVEYSLINRKVEKNGLLKLCQERGIKLIAYSPLGQGVLSGKYSADNPMSGVRARRYDRKFLEKLDPLLTLMRQIGEAHERRSPAQVAINWVMCKGALPIPGAKTVAQSEHNARATGWRLNEEEIALLDAASDKL
ncbi:MAG: aldo/keto reductase [Anaerolineae bacterium]|nr:aldo/keto reductase [Anaerolineae bacterium]